MIHMFPEYDMYIAPDGTELRFDRLSDLFIQSFDGYGMSPIKYLEQQGAFQHGVSIYDYRLQKRIIQWTIRQDSCNRWTYWENRANILDLLRPNRHTINNFGPGKLRKFLPDGTMRDLDVHLELGPIFSSPTGHWDEWGYTEVIRFVAPDPTFYNPLENSYLWNLGPAQTHLVFPITFPIQFGYTVVSATTPITYVGTWMSFPTIIIRGPIAGFTITNSETGEMIRLNYKIAPGVIVTISLEFGNKTVTTAAGVNLIGVVSTDSDLSTFHFAPAPEVAGGINTMIVSGAGCNPNTRITLSHYTRYIGI